MKVAALVLIGLLLGAEPPSGGGFTLRRSTIDSGGGQGDGGNFTLRGTIGQPESGVMTGGAFTLRSGFWTAVVDADDKPADLMFSNGFED